MNAGDIRESFHVDGAAPGDPAAPVQDARPENNRRDNRPQGERREGYKGNPRGDKPQGDKPQGDRPRADKPDFRKDRGKDQRPDAKPQKAFEARPPRVEKPIDPDNPFAALAALKSRL